MFFLFSPVLLNIEIMDIKNTQIVWSVPIEVVYTAHYVLVFLLVNNKINIRSDKIFYYVM